MHSQPPSDPRGNLLCTHLTFSGPQLRYHHHFPMVLSCLCSPSKSPFLAFKIASPQRNRIPATVPTPSARGPRGSAPRPLPLPRTPEPRPRRSPFPATADISGRRWGHRRGTAAAAADSGCGAPAALRRNRRGPRAAGDGGPGYCRARGRGAACSHLLSGGALGRRRRRRGLLRDPGAATSAAAAGALSRARARGGHGVEGVRRAQGCPGGCRGPRASCAGPGEGAGGGGALAAPHPPAGGRGPGKGTGGRGLRGWGWGGGLGGRAGGAGAGGGCHLEALAAPLRLPPAPAAAFCLSRAGASAPHLFLPAQEPRPRPPKLRLPQDYLITTPQREEATGAPRTPSPLPVFLTAPPPPPSWEDLCRNSFRPFSAEWAPVVQPTSLPIVGSCKFLGPRVGKGN